MPVLAWRSLSGTFPTQPAGRFADASGRNRRGGKAGGRGGGAASPGGARGRGCGPGVGGAAGRLPDRRAGPAAHLHHDTLDDDDLAAAADLNLSDAPHAFPAITP